MRKWIAGTVAAVAASALARPRARRRRSSSMESPGSRCSSSAPSTTAAGRRALEYARVKTEQALGVEIAYTENIPEDNSEILRAIDLYVGRGHNIIIGTSLGLWRRLPRGRRQVSRRGFRELRRRDEQRPRTLRAFYARSYQGWYLAGIVAGHVTQSGKIGHRRPPQRGELGSQRFPARRPVGGSRDRNGRRLREHLVRPGEGDAGGGGPARAGASTCWARI